MIGVISFAAIADDTPVMIPPRGEIGWPCVLLSDHETVRLNEVAVVFERDVGER
jgi:hypothetical protein